MRLKSPGFSQNPSRFNKGHFETDGQHNNPTITRDLDHNNNPTETILP